MLKVLANRIARAQSGKMIGTCSASWWAALRERTCRALLTRSAQKWSRNGRAGFVRGENYITIKACGPPGPPPGHSCLAAGACVEESGACGEAFIVIYSARQAQPTFQGGQTELCLTSAWTLLLPLSAPWGHPWPGRVQNQIRNLVSHRSVVCNVSMSALAYGPRLARVL